MGYTFESAVADLVDNAIDACATKIDIYFSFNGINSTVKISDNGKGMDQDAMKEAMRFGTERDYDLDALGKFGLGLKLASLSQCRKFIVVSRHGDSKADAHAMAWDMEHLKQTKKWEVLRFSENEIPEHVVQPIEKSTGTVVFWENLEEFSNYKNPLSGHAKNRMEKMCRKLEDHLAAVFHRFITDEAGGPAIEIAVNDNLVSAWDPFARNEKYTQQMDTVNLRVEEVEGSVEMIPFVLPHQNQFSTQEAFKAASGQNRWNKQQGFYIYRAGRLIQSGGWCGFRVVDEHIKLARVALLFPPSLDDIFQTNIRKTSIRFPSVLVDQIKKHLGPVIKSAQESYRHSKKNKTVHTQNYQTQNKEGKKLTNHLVVGKWTFREFVSFLKGFAHSDELPVLKKIVKRAQSQVKKSNEI